MNSNEPGNLIVGLDVGSSKIRVIACETNSSGGLDIVGIGQSPSIGVKRGMISNIEQTIASMERAVGEAEDMMGRKIENVFTGITGTHIRSYNSPGVVAVKDREVDADDIERVIESAGSVAISNDERVLHVLPQSFIIDDQPGIHDPIGLSAMRMEVRVHVVTGTVSAVQNILKCVGRCGLRTKEVILNHIASAHAVLTEDEMDLGVCLLDIGEGTCDLAVYHDKSIRHSSVIPIAGAQLTRDIAVTLRTSKSEAESLKHRSGCAIADMVDDQEMVELSGLGDGPVRQQSQRLLAEVMQPRMEELYGKIKEDLEKANYAGMIGSGFVLAGGTARMAGVCELAERVFDAPVRIGVPLYDGALSEVVHHPSFATAVGLCQFGHANRGSAYGLEREEEPSGSGIFARLKEHFSDLGGSVDTMSSPTARLD